MNDKKSLADGTTTVQILGVLDSAGSGATVDTIWQYDTDKIKLGISRDGKIVKAWSASKTCEATSTTSYVCHLPSSALSFLQPDSRLRIGIMLRSSTQTLFA